MFFLLPLCWGVPTVPPPFQFYYNVHIFRLFYRWICFFFFFFLWRCCFFLFQWIYWCWWNDIFKKWFLCCFCCCWWWCFYGGLFPPRVTWVHPFSSLLGWSPVSGLGLWLVGVVVAAAVVVVVGGGNVGLVVFWGQDLEKWPSCLQFQHCGLLPSTTTIMTWSS